MSWVDILKGIVLPVVVSLITFVVTTVIYAARKEKRRAKTDVFSVLLSTRNINDYNAVKAYNSIDVVFSDSKEICDAWHEYLNSLTIRADGTLCDFDTINEKQTKLLEKMAKNLGYNNITWDLIKKTYIPKWVVDQQNGNQAMSQLYQSLTQPNVVWPQHVPSNGDTKIVL